MLCGPIPRTFRNARGGPLAGFPRLEAARRCPRFNAQPGARALWATGRSAGSAGFTKRMYHHILCSGWARIHSSKAVIWNRPDGRSSRIALFQLDGERLLRCGISEAKTETLGQGLTFSYALGIYIAGRGEIALPGEAKNRRLRHARQKTIV